MELVVNTIHFLLYVFLLMVYSIMYLKTVKAGMFEKRLNALLA